MRVTSITAIKGTGKVAHVAVASTLEKAEKEINEKLERECDHLHGSGRWIYLSLPRTDPNITRSTVLGNIQFLIDDYEV